MDGSPRKSGGSEVERAESDGTRGVGCREEEVRRSPEGGMLRRPKSEGCAECATREVRDEGEVGRVGTEVQRSGGMGK